MTKKDYELIAYAIKEVKTRHYFLADPIAQDAIKKVAENIAQALMHDNPRFIYDKFIEACGIRTLEE